MAGRRRRGRAAAGAVNLLTELVLNDQKEARERKQRAAELFQKFQYETKLKELEEVYAGRAGYDPQTGAFGRTMPTTPAIPSGLEVSGLSYKDASGVTHSYGRPLREAVPRALDPSLVASRLGALTNNLSAIEQRNADAQAMADPGSKGFFGFGKRPAVPAGPTTDVSGLQSAQAQLQALLAESADGQPGSGALTGGLAGALADGLPSDLPDTTDPSLGDEQGNTEGAQVQSSEDGQIYEVRDGQWVLAQ